MAKTDSKSSNTNQFIKMMSDKRYEKIITATAPKKGVSTGEISKKTGIPASHLYYLIKNLQDTDMVKVVGKKRVRNLEKFYYSSYDFNHQMVPNFKTGKYENKENLKEGPWVPLKWSIDHQRELSQYALYQTQQYLEATRKQFANYKKDHDIKKVHISRLNSEVSLSPQAEYKLIQDFSQFISQAEKNDHGKNKQKIHLSLLKW